MIAFDNKEKQKALDLEERKALLIREGDLQDGGIMISEGGDARTEEARECPVHFS